MNNPLLSSGSVEEKITKAFERRFGKSMCPLHFHNEDKWRIRARDPETGTWAIYDTAAWRIRRIAEFDAAAN